MTDRTRRWMKWLAGSAVLVALVAAVGGALFFTSAAEAARQGVGVSDDGVSGRRGYAGERRGFGRLANAQAIADALNMSLAELREAWSSGLSLEEIAAAQGVEITDVADAVIAANEARLADAVENGELTQEQADNMTERMELFALARIVFDKDAFKAVIADLLNVSVDELREARINRELVDLANAAGVSLDDVQAAVQAEKARQIEAALDAGTITQEEADQLSDFGLKRLRKHNRPNRTPSVETNA